MDRNLAHAFPPLATKAWAIKAAYEAEFPTRELRVIGVWRSTEEQQALYAQGRTTPGHIVTARDGITKKSTHQGTNPAGLPCSFAVDFGVFMSGNYCTDEDYYRPLQDMAHEQGLKSGWDFPTLAPGAKADPPHVEWADVDSVDWSLISTHPTSDSTAI